MPVRVRIFEEDGRPCEEQEIDTVRDPRHMYVDALKELLALVRLKIGWKLCLDAATTYERNTWGRADTLARFRRAIGEGRAIVYRGRPRPMNEGRIARYEKVIREFPRPMIVIADDPAAVLCLDFVFPTGR